jgi:phosphoribosylformylglycinamidine cyclo-ligase
VFQVMEKAGSIPLEDMRRTFNMGIGLVVACEAASAAQVLADLQAQGESAARVIGQIVPGPRRVRYLHAA